MNELEQNYWNTEISDSLLDSIADSGLEWLKYWPDPIALLIARGVGELMLWREEEAAK